MLHITSLDDGLEVFKALGSEIRIQILKLLMENGRMSMNQLAGQLNITNGALTGHVKKLEECGLISVSSESAGHGNQKLCSVMHDKILVDFEAPIDYDNAYSSEIKVGHYTDCKVRPTCGLATAEGMIGDFDDIRFFNHPDRYDADIIWFSQGYIEYMIPNFIPFHTKITQISVTMEIGSEAPGYNNNWPSDIVFSVNGIDFGTWTMPGDFGDKRGMFNPDWWPDNINQYGLQKVFYINKYGTYMDGIKLSDKNINELDLDSDSTIRFRMTCDDPSRHVGGLTIYGKNFGNYNHNIRSTIYYVPIE